MRVLLLGDSLTAGMPGVGYMRFLPALLPECEFINEGACGDTVGGLHRRVRQMRHAPAELALVWIGTNDACRLEPGSELVRWFGKDYERLLVDILSLAPPNPGFTWR